MPTTILPYLPLLSMAGWIAMFASKHRSLFLGDCMGLVYHLALVPVVGLLPGGEALRFIGYLWLLSDSMVDMASINGVDHDTCWRVRMCVHLPAAIWNAGASAGITGPALVIGVPLGVGLLLHAMFGPRLKNTRQVLGSFVVPGMIAWLASVAFYLGAFGRWEGGPLKLDGEEPANPIP